MVRRPTSRRNLNSSGPRLECLESRLTPTASVTSLYDPSTLLIKLNPSVESQARAGFLHLLPGVELEKSMGAVPGLWQARITDPYLSVSQASSALSLDPRVSYVSVNSIHTAASIPNDPRFSSQWDLSPNSVSIHATTAWDNFTGNGITLVAVFDSGVDINHPDLKARIWTNSAETPGDGIDNDGNGIVDDVYGASFGGKPSGDVSDVTGHGTAVAGLIGATGNNAVGISGVNWAARILPLRVIQNGQALDSDILAAMDYASKAGAKIWNLSLGGGAYSRAMADALDAASSRGVIIVTAAGNSGKDIDLAPSFPASYSAEHLVVVAGTDEADNLAGFSNYGVATVDLAAPSTNLLTTTPGGGYGLQSGTSMSSALVTGALSLLWDANPGASAGAILDQLYKNITVLDSLKGKISTAGRLDLAPVAAPGQVATPPVGFGSIPGLPVATLPVSPPPASPTLPTAPAVISNPIVVPVPTVQPAPVAPPIVFLPPVQPTPTAPIGFPGIGGLPLICLPGMIGGVIGLPVGGAIGPIGGIFGGIGGWIPIGGTFGSPAIPVGPVLQPQPVAQPVPALPVGPGPVVGGVIVPGVIVAPVPSPLPPAPAPVKLPETVVADPVSDDVWGELPEDEGYAWWEESDFFRD